MATWKTLDKYIPANFRAGGGVEWDMNALSAEGLFDVVGLKFIYGLDDDRDKWEMQFELHDKPLQGFFFYHDNTHRHMRLQGALRDGLLPLKNCRIVSKDRQNRRSKYLDIEEELENGTEYDEADAAQAAANSRL